MKILVGDAKGNVLGSADILGSPWVITDYGMTNSLLIKVPITEGSGWASHTAFLNNAGGLIDGPGDFSPARWVGLSDTIVFQPGKVHMRWPFIKPPPMKIALPPERFPWFKRFVGAS